MVLDDISTPSHKSQLCNCDLLAAEQECGDSVLLSTGLSSKRVFLRAKSASLCNFSVVPVMPRPMSAARFANSDLAPLFLGPPSPDSDPFCLCPSVKRFSLSPFPLCLRFACASTALNSAVRSWMLVTILEGSRYGSRVGGLSGAAITSWPLQKRRKSLVFVQETWRISRNLEQERPESMRSSAVS